MLLHIGSGVDVFTSCDAVPVQDVAVAVGVACKRLDNRHNTGVVVVRHNYAQHVQPLLFPLLDAPLEPLQGQEHHFLACMRMHCTPSQGVKGY